jgi:putative Mg2+ transporter-C (MgtC) family protein
MAEMTEFWQPLRLEDMGRDFVRPVTAIVLGMMLGWNRELRGRAAGLRTQMLVSLGACVFTISALHLFEAYPDSRLDPIRVVSGIVGGIGFLGAGSVIQARGEIRGVTTAATVWISGATGLACGLGLYQLAIINVSLCLLTLIAFRGFGPKEDPQESA